MPRETPAVAHRAAHQQHGALRRATSEGQRLAVVGPSITRGCEGALQFALQECIRSNATRRDTLGVGVEQGGIGEFVGGRNEVFQQRAQLRRFDVLAADISSAGDLDRRREVGEHHAQGPLVLGKIICQRAGDRVLQQHFVGFEPVAVDGLHLRRIEVHGNNADDQKDAEDYVENRDARRIRWFGRQVAPQAQLVSVLGKVAADVTGIPRILV